MFDRITDYFKSRAAGDTTPLKSDFEKNSKQNIPTPIDDPQKKLKQKIQDGEVLLKQLTSTIASLEIYIKLCKEDKNSSFIHRHPYITLGYLLAVGMVGVTTLLATGYAYSTANRDVTNDGLKQFDATPIPNTTLTCGDIAYPEELCPGSYWLNGTLFINNEDEFLRIVAYCNQILENLCHSLINNPTNFTLLFSSMLTGVVAITSGAASCMQQFLYKPALCAYGQLFSDLPTDKQINAANAAMKKFDTDDTISSHKMLESFQDALSELHLKADTLNELIKNDKKLLAKTKDSTSAKAYRHYAGKVVAATSTVSQNQNPAGTELENKIGFTRNS